MTNFSIRNEYGVFIAGGLRYEVACEVTHWLRRWTPVDYFVIDPATGRAISEVIEWSAWLEDKGHQEATRLLDTAERARYA